MATELEFHHDPGHGWLRVPASEVEAVGAARWLSGYSYARVEGAGHPQRFYYLEEDMDAATFRALWARDGREPFQVRDVIHDRDFAIRRHGFAPKGEAYTFEGALALIKAAREG